MSSRHCNEALPGIDLPTSPSEFASFTVNTSFPAAPSSRSFSTSASVISTLKNCRTRPAAEATRSYLPGASFSSKAPSAAVLWVNAFTLELGSALPSGNAVTLAPKMGCPSGPLTVPLTANEASPRIWWTCPNTWAISEPIIK